MTDPVFQLLQLQLEGVRRDVFTPRARAISPEDYGGYVFSYRLTPAPAIVINIPAEGDLNAYLAEVTRFFEKEIAEGKVQVRSLHDEMISVLFVKR